MNTQKFENLCLYKLVAMMDGWQQWQDNLEDLMIACYALPVYQMHMVKKALRFQDLVKRRKNAMSLLICRMMSC